MDTVTTSRRNQNMHKGNKENAEPAGSKYSLKTGASTAPLKQKRSEKQQIKVNGFQKVKPTKETVSFSFSGDALKKIKTVRNDDRAVNDNRKSISQAFLAMHAVKQRHLAEATNPPIVVPSARSAPGMYKGKVVQSKIGSIWKSSGAITTGTTEKSSGKPSATKAESRNVGYSTKTRSKSVADLHGNGDLKLQPSRSKSVSDELPLVSKRLVTGRPHAGRGPPPPSSRTTVMPRGKGSQSSKDMPPPPPSSRTTVMPRGKGSQSSKDMAPPPPSSRTTVMPRGKGSQSSKDMPPPPPSSRTTVMPRGKGSQSSKDMAPQIDAGNVKKHVCSTLSQYRVSTETAEERREKLAEWLSSKGKSLKRPAMAVAITTAAAPPKAAAKPNIGPKNQVVSQASSELVAKRKPSLDHGPGANAALREEQNRPEEAACDSTPQIMNTTLDLLDNSDMELPVDPEPKMNDIVVNLCDALAALEPPSACEDGEPLPMKVESDLCKDLDYDDEDDDDSDEDLVCQASVVKYSVKTTPYLQSVKKTINGETGAYGSRRKSGIKDLKFLTPVRRSCRIQRKSSRLPGMLVDHDPCVSSLAELVKMDDDPNAYIYRKNPALLEDLPDQPQYF